MATAAASLVTHKPRAPSAATARAAAATSALLARPCSSCAAYPTASPVAAGAAAAGAHPHPAPQLPLCQRPAVHIEPLAALVQWRDAMSERIAAIGDAWELADGGPNAAALRRELEWVLDDAIEACRTRPDAEWEHTSWRMLEPRMRAAQRRRQDTAVWQLRTRAPAAALWEWWERRLKERVPFQYLISSAHWHTFVLAVGPGVLIPRPETEAFAGFVADALARRPHLAAAPWADLGTGSGAIAIAAADELRRRNKAAQVWAVDMSPAAAAYATFNARLIFGGLPASKEGTLAAATSGSSGTSASVGIAAAAAAADIKTAPEPAAAACPVRVVLGSWYGPIRHLRGRLGGVLSNPPYIPDHVMAAGLQAEVGRHEPASALDGGSGGGLAAGLAELCGGAADMLAAGGVLALETAGSEQAEQVAALLRAVTAPPPSAVAASSAMAHGDGGAGGPGGGLRHCGTEGAAARGEVAVGPAFEEVEVLPDCYGVPRFVRAYRTAG